MALIQNRVQVREAKAFGGIDGIQAGQGFRVGNGVYAKSLSGTAYNFVTFGVESFPDQQMVEPVDLFVDQVAP